MVKKELSTDQRNQVVQFLLSSSHGGTPQKGKFKAAASNFGVHKRTVSRYWAAAKEQQRRGEVIHIQSKKVNFPRGRRVHIDLDLICSLPVRKRGSIRTLAIGINVKKTTVGRWVKEGLLRAHTNAIKPNLTAPNKLLRLRFSLEALELDRILNTLRFRSMHNVVHIDEKWFNITRATQRYYMAPGEIGPHRTCKSKKFIEKVMFVCVVARPIFATDGTTLFDGKIGMFPLTHKVPAKRGSKNRPAGTLETKCIELVTQDVMRDVVINELLPAIMDKWPAFASKVIYIQQDNAKPHIKDNDPLFRAAANQNGFTFHLVQQPANSPDTNVNDLGWFRAIQSLQVENACTTIDQLVDAVMLSFEKLTAETLNKVFLSLQGCMVEIMKVRGENSYKVPHMGKEAQIRAGTLPLNLDVPEELVRDCLKYLVEAGNLEGIGEIMNTLGIHTLQEQ